jgi:hypothetical protein
VAGVRKNIFRRAWRFSAFNHSIVVSECSAVSVFRWSEFMESIDKSEGPCGNERSTNSKPKEESRFTAAVLTFSAACEIPLGCQAVGRLFGCRSERPVRKAIKAKKTDCSRASRNGGSRSASMVVIFDDDTPLRVIDTCSPAFL